MIKLNEPFQLDSNNLWYLDMTNVNLTPVIFEKEQGRYPKSSFWKIDNMEDYLIKNIKSSYLFFNQVRTKKYLKLLQDKQDVLSNIDFPVGYSIDNNKLKGFIIPYYSNAISLENFINQYSYSDITKFYQHDGIIEQNIIAICLDILELIRNMYDKGILYFDIHSGNFLLYNNEIKIIDFDPRYMLFNSKKDENLRIMLSNYVVFVRSFLRKLGYKDVLLNYGEDFYETEKRVLGLQKRLERK